MNYTTRCCRKVLDAKLGSRVVGEMTFLIKNIVDYVCAFVLILNFVDYLAKSSYYLSLKCLPVSVFIHCDNASVNLLVSYAPTT